MARWSLARQCLRQCMPQHRFLHVKIIGANDKPQNVHSCVQAMAPISVTAFSTQYNEAEQLAINILQALPRPEPNERMQQGTIEHDKLEQLSLVSNLDQSIFALVNDPAVQHQKDLVKMLDMANKITNLTNGVDVRELSVRGSIDGYKLSGKIDGIELDSSGHMMIVENKTSANPIVSDYKLRLAYHQVLFYHKLLTNLVYQVDSKAELLAAMQVANNLDEKLADQFGAIAMPGPLKTGHDVLDLLFESLGALRASGRRLLPKMQLRFLTAADSRPVLQTYTVDFCIETLTQIVQFRSDLFEGRRLPASGSLKDL